MRKDFGMEVNFSANTLNKKVDVQFAEEWVSVNTIELLKYWDNCMIIVNATSPLSLDFGRTLPEDVANSTTLVTSLGSSIGAVLHDVANL